MGLSLTSADKTQLPTHAYMNIKQLMEKLSPLNCCRHKPCSENTIRSIKDKPCGVIFQIPVTSWILRLTFEPVFAQFFTFYIYILRGQAVLCTDSRSICTVCVCVCVTWFDLSCDSEKKGRNFRCKLRQPLFNAISKSAKKKKNRGGMTSQCPGFGI